MYLQNVDCGYQHERWRISLCGGPEAALRENGSASKRIPLIGGLNQLSFFSLKMKTHPILREGSEAVDWQLLLHIPSHGALYSIIDSSLIATKSRSLTGVQVS